MLSSEWLKNCNDVQLKIDGTKYMLSNYVSVNAPKQWETESLILSESNHQLFKQKKGNHQLFKEAKISHQLLLKAKI
jgi:hypothetical protein